ncbi:MAG: hypothetical protein AAB609_00335 [Patescibacteria group bacterium]
MNNKILLAAGAIILVIVLGGAAFIMSRNSSKAPISTQVTQNEKPVSNQKSLKDLIESGQAQKCTFKDKSASVNVEGTTYVASGKMRGDFNSAVGEKNIMMHMIVNDKTSYTWMDGQTTGYKMVFDPAKMEAPAGSQQSVDVNKVIDYNCSNWTVDSSVFTPPANVKFSEVGAMMVPSGVPTGASVQDKCSVCDALPADSKAECRTALKCN